MKFLPKNTIASYRAIPQAKALDLSAIKCSVFAGSVQKFYVAQNTGSLPVPDAEAIAFYALNHLNAFVEAKFGAYGQLPDWAQKVAAAYQTALAQQSQRMASYLIMITTREARHVKNATTATTGFWKDVLKVSSPAVTSFFKNNKGLNEMDAVSQFMNNPPDSNLGQYTRALTTLFNDGNFSGGYGGTAWGTVAKYLMDAIEGRISLEVMVDSAYALAHNNGPIFNKGMMYSNYTTQFLRVLDIQRSGQMPEAVISGAVGNVRQDVRDLVDLVVGSTTDHGIGAYVDWFKVSALGGVQNYAHEQKKQVQVHGPSKYGPKPVAPAPPSSVAAPVAHTPSPPLSPVYFVTPTTSVQYTHKLNRVGKVA